MSKDRFGFEWQKYNSIADEYHEPYKNQFLNWSYPHTAEFFRGKRILDAGCGMGRNSYWCLQWGAGSLIACDHDERSVAAARATIEKFTNAEVLAADLHELPWQNEFDYIFSIGVIHHTRDPKKVMHELYQAAKPGAEVLLWVYSCEGFEKILSILNPIRIHITSKLPLGLLHFLTYFVSIPLYIYLHMFNPSRPYFQQLRTFAFSHMHSIIFDQLLPPIARYYTRQEARELMHEFENVSVDYPPNKNGWIVRGWKQT